MRVCLGGTFDGIHKGHRALLTEACKDATALFVGVTDDAMAKRDSRAVAPWEERADGVAHALAKLGYDGELEINRLTDGVGPAASKEYDAIVVSPETIAGAERINAQRKGAGLKLLEVRVVPHVLADDLLPFSSTRLYAGDIDAEGRRLTPLRVSVGSANPVKVNGVRRAFERILPNMELAVEGVNVDSGVPEQPRGPQTLEGANRRARAAMEASSTDYAVGVEAGLQQDDAGDWFDVQACVIIDSSGLETKGFGPGFQYPGWVTTRALQGEMISDIVGPIADDDRIGGTTGAIGFLTDGAYMRTEFTEQAVLMAMVPRVRRDLYRRAP